MTLHPQLSPALHLFSQGLANRLKTYRPPGCAPADSSSSSNSSSTSGISSFFKSLFGGGQQAEQTHDQLQNEDSPTSSSSGAQVLYRGGVPLGLYMYGGVGTGATSTIQCAISHYTVLSLCSTTFHYSFVLRLHLLLAADTGKTFMMDVFYKSAPVPQEQKQRVHFLDFMMEVHQRMHRLRQQARNAVVLLDSGADAKYVIIAAAADYASANCAYAANSSGGSGISGEQLIDRVVTEMMGQGWLLCFDEFQYSLHCSRAPLPAMNEAYRICTCQCIVVALTECVMIAGLLLERHRALSLTARTVSCCVQGEHRFCTHCYSAAVT
eukprot:5048-Heterococcus_DN1.PRE.9